MSNQIRVLSESTELDGSILVTAVFWLTAPSNAQTPVPGFVSLDPNIDTATWSLCQQGLLVEQQYASGAFPSGTSGATVQAALVAAYSAAQSALTNPPVGVIGNTYNGSAWSALVEPTFFLTAPVSVSMAWVAAMGRLFGVTADRAAGYVATSATSNAAVRATPYTAPGSNGQRSLVSTSANDTAAGTGARTVLVTYLDAAFAVHQETVTLNGTTPVNTAGTNIAYVESMKVATVGAGAVNAGVISMTSAVAGGGSTVGSIAVADQQTWWCHHYVPAGVTCYLLSFSGAGTVVGGVTNLIHLPSLAVAGAPTTQIGPILVHSAPGRDEHKFDAPLAIPGPDLVYANEAPLAVTASKTFANIEYMQF